MRAIAGAPATSASGERVPLCGNGAPTRLQPVPSKRATRSSAGPPPTLWPHVTCATPPTDASWGLSATSASPGFTTPPAATHEPALKRLTCSFWTPSYSVKATNGVPPTSAMETV